MVPNPFSIGFGVSSSWVMSILHSFISPLSLYPRTVSLVISSSDTPSICWNLLFLSIFCFVLIFYKTCHSILSHAIPVVTVEQLRLMPLLAKGLHLQRPAQPSARFVLSGWKLWCIGLRHWLHGRNHNALANVYVSVNAEVPVVWWDDTRGGGE